MLIFVQVYRTIDKNLVSYKVLKGTKESNKIKRSTKRKLKASEEKRF